MGRTCRPGVVENTNVRLPRSVCGVWGTMSVVVLAWYLSIRRISGDGRFGLWKSSNRWPAGIERESERDLRIV